MVEFNDDENMTMEELVDRLENDTEFSAEALADRHRESALDPQVIVNWREITGMQRINASRALVEWVHEWLIPRYAVKTRTVPDCWWQHGDLIEELSALHTAWLVAFDPADAGYGPVGWHERYAAALQRSTMRSRCEGGHRADLVRVLPEIPESL
ncbi:DUF4913 domain-containing protein [Microbacterium sp. YY-01]|uniref:DUF4913 domain-containing protein n=1 Tax=Microbacterium sp. YY-01 TaxID=3421634 RepID=UPI003D17DDB0